MNENRSTHPTTTTTTSSSTIGKDTIRISNNIAEQLEPIANMQAKKAYKVLKNIR